MSHHTNPWHCALDWLGRAAIALLVFVGLLYASAYTVGFPNLPDPDKQYRRMHGIEQRHKCMHAPMQSAEDHP